MKDYSHSPTCAKRGHGMAECTCGFNEQAEPLAVIDIPAGYPNEAAFVEWLRAKGYDANVCDSARVLWNGFPMRWSAPTSTAFDALEAEFMKATFTDPVAAELAAKYDPPQDDDAAIIRIDGKAIGWTRGTAGDRLQQRGVPEHIALAAITLAVLGGKAIVFGADGAQITVERG